jgi:hypothetical protein
MSQRGAVTRRASLVSRFGWRIGRPLLRDHLLDVGVGLHNMGSEGS